MDETSEPRVSPSQTSSSEPADLPCADLDDVVGGMDPAKIAGLADLSEAELLTVLKQSLSQF